MSIEDLIIILHIEEDNRGFEKKVAYNSNETKANFVEYGQGSKFNKANNKGKGTKLGPKGRVSKNLKFQGKSSTMGSKITNLRIVDYQRGTNPKKLMWLMTSVRMCLTLTSQ